MTGQMWEDAKVKFEGRYVRLFVSGLTKPLGNSDGHYTGMWTFVGNVSMRANYVIVEPGGQFELWLAAEKVDAIALDEDDDEDDDPEAVDWDDVLKSLEKKEK